jgi:hypothetical protein
MAEDTNSKLVINFNGLDAATTYTAESGQTVTFVNQAQLDTAQKKFGTSSLLLDGTTDYVSVPASSDFSFGSGDFTIDFWARWASVPTGTTPHIFFSSGACFKAWYSPDFDCISFEYHKGGAEFLLYNASCWSDPQINTWYHFAVVRNGTSLKWYKDGVLLSSSSIGTDTIDACSQALTFGYDLELTRWSFNGWFDCIRVSKGIARWTSNFTPPDAEYFFTQNKACAFTLRAVIKKVAGVLIAAVRKVLGLQ